MSEDQEGLEIIRFFYQKRKSLSAIFIAAAITAVVVTAFMPKKFKSTATVYPPGYNSAERMLENPQFGYNIEADRLIQIGESMSLKDSVIEKFNLADYYEIDTEQADWKYRLLKAYNQDIRFIRTKYMSVQIEVVNKDPEMAAQMANEMVEMLSRFWERLFKNNMVISLDYAQQMYLQKQQEVNRILDSIYALRNVNSNAKLMAKKDQLSRKEGELEALLKSLASLRESGNFYDYSAEMEILSKEMLEINRIIEMEKGKLEALENMNLKGDSTYAVRQGKYKGALAHKKNLDQKLLALNQAGKGYDKMFMDFEKGMEQFNEITLEYENLLYAFEPLVESVKLDFLQSRYLNDRQMLSELKRTYEKAHKLYFQPLPNLFIIEGAVPVYKKDSPSFLINALVAGFFTLILSILFMLFREKIQSISAELKS